MMSVDIGSTAKDSAVNTSPPVSHNDQVVSPSSDGENPGVPQTLTGSKSDPSKQTAQGNKGQGHEVKDNTKQGPTAVQPTKTADEEINKQSENRVSKPTQNVYGGKPQTNRPIQDENFPADQKRHSSIGKRPRKDKDTLPLQNKIRITSIEDEEEDNGYDPSRIQNSIDMLFGDSGPQEMHYEQYNSEPGGVQTTTCHSRNPLFVSGKACWHAPKQEITSNIWYMDDLILTAKSDDPVLRCSQLEKNPLLRNFADHLTATTAWFRGYYLRDKSTKKCIFSIKEDCDLDFVPI